MGKIEDNNDVPLNHAIFLRMVPNNFKLVTQMEAEWKQRYS